MKNPVASIKRTVLFAGIFALGLTASGGLRYLVDGVSRPAEASPNGGCHLSDLKGKWGYQYTGDFVGAGKVNGIGVETIDSQGHVVGTDTYSVDGVGTTVTFTGELTLNSECKGTAVLSFADGTVSNAATVLVNDRDELLFVSVDPGLNLVGSLKRR